MVHQFIWAWGISKSQLSSRQGRALAWGSVLGLGPVGVTLESSGAVRPGTLWRFATSTSYLLRRGAPSSLSMDLSVLPAPPLPLPPLLPPWTQKPERLVPGVSWGDRLVAGLPTTKHLSYVPKASATSGRREEVSFHPQGEVQGWS